EFVGQPHLRDLLSREAALAMNIMDGEHAGNWRDGRIVEQHGAKGARPVVYVHDIKAAALLGTSDDQSRGGPGEEPKTLRVVVVLLPVGTLVDTRSVEQGRSVEEDELGAGRQLRVINVHFRAPFQYEWSQPSCSEQSPRLEPWVPRRGQGHLVTQLA